MSNPRIVIEVGKDNNAVVYVRQIEPYEAIRLLVATALALIEGKAEFTFTDGEPLTNEEEEEIISSLVEGTPHQTGGNRDN